MDWQAMITSLIVGAAAVYVAWFIFKMLRRGKVESSGGTCRGCQGCSAGNQKLVTLEPPSRTHQS